MSVIGPRFVRAVKEAAAADTTLLPLSHQTYVNLVAGVLDAAVATVKAEVEGQDIRAREWKNRLEKKIVELVVPQLKKRPT